MMIEREIAGDDNWCVKVAVITGVVDHVILSVGDGPHGYEWGQVYLTVKEAKKIATALLEATDEQARQETKSEDTEKGQ